MTIEELHRLWDSKTTPKRGGKSSHSEHDLQTACVNWFRMQYPQHIIYAIPNGGQRNTIVAAKLKAEGVTAGIPDLHIPIARHGSQSLYIEMKNGKQGRLSEHQKHTIQILQDAGHRVAVCRDMQEFINEVKNYLS